MAAAACCCLLVLLLLLLLLIYCPHVWARIVSQHVTACAVWGSLFGHHTVPAPDPIDRILGVL
jgi:hypothetical protein